MKKYYFLLFTLIISTGSFGQSVGDIAFIGFNADGDDDFSIVALANIPANTTIYFSDDELNGAGGFEDSNEGNIQWDTPDTVITAGTVVVFTDTDSDANPSYGVSLGTITELGAGTINLAGGGDALFAYLGTDENTPTTFLAGIQNEVNNFGDLTGSGLTEGSTFVTFTTSGNPDGGQYTGARDSETLFSNYLLSIANPTNWTINATDGEAILPLDTTPFIESSMATPTINVSSAVSNLDYFEGNGPSDEGSFTISGTNLTTNLTITAPVNFEISLLSDTSFGSMVTLSPDMGTVTSTQVYVRLITSLPENFYTGDITASSSGATDKTITLSGTVSPAVPQFTISGTINEFSYFEGFGPSAEDSFSISGLFLTSDITIAAPPNYEISLTTNTGFGSSVLITPVLGSVADTTIFVRLADNLSPESYSGDITISTTGTMDQTIGLTGIVFQAAVCANVGDVIITEVMQNPMAAGNDPNGEYFELYNTTGNPIDIANWIIEDDNITTENHIITAPSLIIPPNDYIVIGNAATPNGGITFDYTYDNDISLGNGTDGIILSCNATTIDQVIWDNGATFPDPTGASMELSIDDLNSIDNDNGANWATAITPFGSGDLGTPGTVNDNSTVLSVDSFDQPSFFKVYPNPVNTGYVHITSASTIQIDATVFDLTGTQILYKKIDKNVLNVSGLSTGVYILQLKQNEITITKKMIIQ